MNNILILVLFIFSFIFGDEIIFIRYFLSEKDFISNITLNATKRRGIEHIAAYYNNKNLAVKLEYFSNNGILKKKMILEYDQHNQLSRKGHINENSDYIDLIIYGDEEPWSREFRKWQYDVKTSLTFEDQKTLFTIPEGRRVKKIIFETVDGVNYGQIDLEYDYLNFLSEERWREMPSGKIIRTYKYKVDIMADVTQIWEYGRSDSLISSVALDKAPEDQLYKTPPPRLGNTLDEVDLLTKEILAKKVITNFDPLINSTYYDKMILFSGDMIQVDFVSFSDGLIRFRMPKQEGLLTISISKVESLTSRVGDVIYNSSTYKK